MLVAVGSTNPVKINSVRTAFGLLWPEQDWTVEGVAVASGVAEQPMTDEETRQGARTRASHARERLDADYGVGLESGLHPADGRWFNSGWVVVVDRTGVEGVGSTIRMVVPPRLMEIVHAGGEVGAACDEIFKGSNTKQGKGLCGVLSNGAIDRTRAFTDAVVSSLTLFLHPELTYEFH